MVCELGMALFWSSAVRKDSVLSVEDPCDWRDGQLV